MKKGMGLRQEVNSQWLTGGANPLSVKAQIFKKKMLMLQLMNS